MDAAKAMRSERSQRHALGFGASVEREFEFLGKHGFIVRRREPTLVRFESDGLGIDVYHGRQSYEIGLLIGPAKPVSAQGYAMSVQLDVAVPELAHGYRNYAALEPDAVRRGVSELARLFRLCVDRGILTERDLLERVAERGAQAAHDYAAEVLLSQTRRKIEAACLARDYAEVVELLRPVEHLGGEAEGKKLRYARRKAGPRD
jgi:hypothetical protein